MSIASAAGRPTRLRPVEARQPARATVAADGLVAVALPHWSFVTLALQAV